MTNLCTQMLVHFKRLDGRGFHVYVPELERQVVATENIPTTRAKLDVANGCNDLREKVAATRGLLLLEQLRVLVTQRRGAHVRQTDVSLGRHYTTHKREIMSRTLVTIMHL